MVFNYMNLPFPIYFGLDGMTLKEICLNFEELKLTQDFFVFEIMEKDGKFIPESIFSGYWPNAVLNIKENFDEENLSNNKNFKNQIKYGLHLNAYALLLPTPGKKNLNYAKYINKFLCNNIFNTEIWIRMNINDREGWKNLNSFRMALKNDNKLGIYLELSEDLPEKEELNFLEAENIKVVNISSNLFLSSLKNEYYLIEYHKKLLVKLIEFKTSISVCVNENDKIIPIKKFYNCFEILLKNLPHLSELEYIQSKFYDIPQTPLQPCSQNLSFDTYMAFEKDFVKYELYSKAFTEFLKEWMSKNKAQEKLMILFVGPGRGGILKKIIQICIDQKINFQIYAVERNKYISIALKSFLQENKLEDNTLLINDDIRNLNFENAFEIVISEMLGSFGDNELSPEILYKINKMMKVNAISIPGSYTSYISPISCVSAYNNVSLIENGFEKPHVIAFKKYSLSHKAESCFFFSHENIKHPPSNLKQYKNFTFSFDKEMIINGFGGFFDSILFKKITLSTLPENKTAGLLSWYPFFFPLKTPFLMNSGQILSANFWRCNRNGKVWYEWEMEIYSKADSALVYRSPIHNENGKYYFMMDK